MGACAFARSVLVMILVTTSTTYALMHDAEVCIQRHAHCAMRMICISLPVAASITLLLLAAFIDGAYMHAGDRGVLPQRAAAAGCCGSNSGR